MPYIKQVNRKPIDKLLNGLLEYQFTVGELNYVITRLIDTHCAERGYQILNDAVGVLECVKQEFYRRRVAPFEDEKCRENGEVYV